jgi:ribosomal protein S4
LREKEAARRTPVAAAMNVDSIIERLCAVKAQRAGTAVQLAERDTPEYYEVDHSKMTAKLSRVPLPSEVPYPVQMEPNLVIEFYSR